MVTWVALDEQLPLLSGVVCSLVSGVRFYAGVADVLHFGLFGRDAVHIRQVDLLILQHDSCGDVFRGERYGAIDLAAVLSSDNVDGVCREANAMVRDCCEDVSRQLLV